MTYAFIAFILATFFAVVGTLLLIAKEADLAGLATAAWFGISFVFFVLAHWIPGPAR